MNEWATGRRCEWVWWGERKGRKKNRKRETERRRDREWTIEHHSKVVSNWMEREIQCALPIHNANKVFFLLISVWLVCFPFWPHVSRFYFIYFVLFFATLPTSLPPANPIVLFHRNFFFFRSVSVRIVFYGLFVFIEPNAFLTKCVCCVRESLAVAQCTICPISWVEFELVSI